MGTFNFAIMVSFYFEDPTRKEDGILAKDKRPAPYGSATQCFRS